ncbi:hypothetical protein NFHSH190041_19290 [Shewanella sp. NFH-SH190041]|nr:hypothetical protein NFHSH190041_19290 [Shewanella sp. NFH-SH190041]
MKIALSLTGYSLSEESELAIKEFGLSCITKYLNLSYAAFSATTKKKFTYYKSMG